jgi:hypothetical protein
MNAEEIQAIFTKLSRSRGAVKSKLTVLENYLAGEIFG